jgi:hypothetical protein
MMHPMWLFAEAWAAGAAFGTAVRWIFLIAVGAALVRKLRSGAGTTGTQVGLVAVVALLGASAYFDLGRDGGASAAAVDRDRVNFVAGCTDSGAPAAYCGCMFDELRSAGIDTEAEMEAMGRDVNASGVPRALAAAMDACA